MSLQVVQQKFVYTSNADLANATGIVATMDFSFPAIILRAGIVAHDTEAACDCVIAFEDGTSNITISPTAMADGKVYYDVPASEWKVVAGTDISVNVTANTNTVYTSGLTYFVDYIRLDEVEANLSNLVAK